jgi:hypothetical protein
VNGTTIGGLDGSDDRRRDFTLLLQRHDYGFTICAFSLKLYELGSVGVDGPVKGRTSDGFVRSSRSRLASPEAEAYLSTAAVTMDEA